MLMSHLTKQGKQELHTFFVHLYALSHPYDPKKERGMVPTPCKKESLLGQERKWEQVWAQETCLEWLLNVLPSVPPSDGSSRSFPLFPSSNRDKLCTLLHVIARQRSLTERNFHYSSLNSQGQNVVKCNPNYSTGKGHSNFFQVFLCYSHSRWSAVT